MPLILALRRQRQEDLPVLSRLTCSKEQVPGEASKIHREKPSWKTKKEKRNFTSTIESSFRWYLMLASDLAMNTKQGKKKALRISDWVPVPVVVVVVVVVPLIPALGRNGQINLWGQGQPGFDWRICYSSTITYFNHLPTEDRLLYLAGWGDGTFL